MLVKKSKITSPDGIFRIFLNNRISVIVDYDDYYRLSGYHWKLKRSNNCFYAVRKVKKDGKIQEIKMHRVIAKTPAGYECHHLNHDTLDNRKSNLQNLSKNAHLCAHGKK